MARKASAGAMSSTGMRLEVSFDGGITWKRIFGVYDMSTSGGDAQTEQRTPLDLRPYTRASQRGSQDLNVTIDNLSWMAGIRRVEASLDKTSNETFSIRMVRPEIILSAYQTSSNVEISIGLDGAVTFGGSGAAPDLLEDPYGIGNGIQVNNKMFIVDDIEENAGGVTSIVVDPAPTLAVANADDFSIVRPGCIFGPAEVAGGNISGVWANSGSAQQSAIFHLSGRIGSPSTHIGLT